MAPGESSHPPGGSLPHVRYPAPRTYQTIPTRTSLLRSQDRGLGDVLQRDAVCILVGGPNKTVEIDESKFGRWKYNRGRPVKGQWVFGGMERESGRAFLVPVPDRTADTLTSVIRAWIEPRTTLISDCWAAYQDMVSHGYTHRNVNHSISFVNPDTGDHTNHIESTWCHVKAFLRPYNR